MAWRTIALGCIFALPAAYIALMCTMKGFRQKGQEVEEAGGRLPLPGGAPMAAQQEIELTTKTAEPADTGADV